MEYFREKQRPFILIMRGFRIKLAIIRYFASKKKRLRKNLFFLLAKYLFSFHINRNLSTMHKTKNYPTILIQLKRRK